MLKGPAYACTLSADIYSIDIYQCIRISKFCGNGNMNETQVWLPMCSESIYDYHLRTEDLYEEE